ncbi:type III pantothenate kinase [Urechidicola vernalis]|uniref:Type III pantothenate kinase n=1 Tax=Urechidicola vernalis TaxID=3075600 RepID=A0ABU2Y6I0_9FLAO|nr:type III pantothenate kinase [Urechidicola sp. P050]MDT0552850.1 type III pantothenate kinase [Urechidicola sp. P050]
MNLVIDVGNTFAKVALFEDANIIYQDVFSKKEILLKLLEIHKKHKINRAIISSVANLSTNQLVEIRQIFPIHELSATSKVPFKNAYATPKTLGVDRIALAAAAFVQYPKKNVLVVDAGTCITFDFIDANGSYLGGAISPGLEMRFKAMHTFTDKLPHLKKSENINLIGNSTETSMQSGVVNGLTAEINGIIQRYKSKYQKLTVVLTGGDTYFLANQLKNSIFANPNFLLEGLNSILIHNCKDD